MTIRVDCERCFDTGWAMDHPDDEFVTDRAVPCPHCAREDYEAYRRGEVYWRFEPVPDWGSG